MAILACGFRAFQGLRLWFLVVALVLSKNYNPLYLLIFLGVFMALNSSPSRPARL